MKSVKPKYLNILRLVRANRLKCHTAGNKPGRVNKGCGSTLAGYDHFFQNPTPLLLRISRFLEKAEDFYKVLIRSNNSEIFLEKLKKIFSDHMLSDTDIPDDLKKILAKKDVTP